MKPSIVKVATGSASYEVVIGPGVLEDVGDLVRLIAPSARSVAIITDNNVGDLFGLTAERKLIANVTVFDLYEGKGIDPDKKSIAIAVTLQPREKTMTDEEIEAVAAKIVAEVTKRTGGVLRA